MVSYRLELILNCWTFVILHWFYYSSCCLFKKIFFSKYKTMEKGRDGGFIQDRNITFPFYEETWGGGTISVCRMCDRNFMSQICSLYDSLRVSTFLISKIWLHPLVKILDEIPSILSYDISWTCVISSRYLASIRQYEIQFLDHNSLQEDYCTH